MLTLSLQEFKEEIAALAFVLPGEPVTALLGGEST